MGHDSFADPQFLWQASADDIAHSTLLGVAPNERPGMMSSAKLKVQLPNGREATLLFKPASGERDDFPGLPPGAELPVRKGTYYRSEIAAYRLSKLLDYHFVPPTIPMEVDGEIGSAQLFLPYSTVGGDLSRSDELRFSPHLNEFQKGQAQAFDYLIGNYDRHGGNWLYTTFGTTNPRLIAIDHGLSFPRGFPDLKPVKLPVTINAMMNRVDPVQMASTLLDAGIEPEAVEGVLGRWIILRAYNGSLDVSTEEQWQAQVENVRTWMKEAAARNGG